MLVENFFWESENINFNLFKYHQFQVNLWDIVIWWHASYASDQALINWEYLHREQLTIFILYFMHSVHDNLSSSFIEPIGFTVQIISTFIILWHFFGLGILIK